MSEIADPPPYEDDDDPVPRMVCQAIDEHTDLINYNALMINGLLQLLLDKGVFTKDEFRRYRLREVADFDQVQAKFQAQQGSAQ